MSLADGVAGTVLCIETFEHVFEVRRAFDEVYRVLEPGGLFVITSPLNFRIHGYPDDYWRMTPNCLRRMMEPYAARLTGYQGYHKFPHTVMGLGVKGPAPADFAAKADELAMSYRAWLRRAEAGRPLAQKVRQGLASVYRSKGERYQIVGLLLGRLHPRRHADAPGACGLSRPGAVGRAHSSISRVNRGPADVDDARSPGHPGARWRHLDRARPDATTRADAQPRRPAGAVRARDLALDDPAGHLGRLDDDDDRLRPGPARRLRPPLLRRRPPAR